MTFTLSTHEKLVARDLYDHGYTIRIGAVRNDRPTVEVWHMGFDTVRPVRNGSWDDAHEFLAQLKARSNRARNL
jgi:hypothetical protein